MSKTTQLISGNNPKGKPVLSLIVKRTYSIDNDGFCSLQEEQLPLNQRHSFYGEDELLFKNDTDLYVYKPLTDIIVKGKARSLGKPTSFSASIEINRLNISFNIIGNRKLYKNRNSKFEFSEAEIINEIPLTYSFAYGGKDLIAEKTIRDKVESDKEFEHIKDVLKFFEGSPYRYPRNPEGKGFIIETSNEALENFELPNIENPYNLLNPENIICNSFENWYKMPIPIASDWVHPGWFPRIAYFGMYPIPNGYDENSYEVKNKLVDENILKSRFKVNNGYFNFRACNGASLGLQSPYLQGGESCKLTNIHPKHKEFIIILPTERPKIKVDGRNGKLLKTYPEIHTVLIEPEDNRLTIVWCGSAKAIRPYFEEELKSMPFEVKW